MAAQPNPATSCRRRSCYPSGCPGTALWQSACWKQSKLNPFPWRWAEGIEFKPTCLFSSPRNAESKLYEPSEELRKWKRNNQPATRSWGNLEKGFVGYELITTSNGLRLWRRRRRSLVTRGSRGSGAQWISRSFDQYPLASGVLGALSAGQKHNFTDSVHRNIVEHKNSPGVKNRHLGRLRHRHGRFTDTKTKFSLNQTRNFSKKKQDGRELSSLHTSNRRRLRHQIQLAEGTNPKTSDSPFFPADRRIPAPTLQISVSPKSKQTP